MAGLSNKLIFSNSIKGRGTACNPANRFDKIEYLAEVISEETDEKAETFFYEDASRSIIAYNDSPDISFEASINPYQGCEHGCAYCYARPFHNYLGLSAGLDFETKIFVKKNAARLLESELSAANWHPTPLALCGVTDPYQPIERKLKITRACLEVLARFRNPVNIITKNELICRDIDLLAELNRFRAVSVCISLSTLNADLAGIMEPRASRPHRRLAAVRKLTEAGIPVGVLVSPVIPGLTDHEIPFLLEEIKRAGAGYAGYITLRLPFGIKTIFESWLNQNFPDRKEKILNRIREMHNGKLYDSAFKSRMRGEGPYAEYISSLFHVAARKAGLDNPSPELSVSFFRRNRSGQMTLFDF